MKLLPSAVATSKFAASIEGDCESADCNSDFSSGKRSSGKAAGSGACANAHAEKADKKNASLMQDLPFNDFLQGILNYKVLRINP
jgi:hypothetical protein